MSKKNKDILTGETKKKKAPKEKDITKVTKPKKKHHGCLNAFIVCTVIFVVLIGAICGGVVFAWGKFVEPQTDLTFSDGFGIITSLYGAKEDKIITNKYDYEADKAAFYEGFKEKLYLSEEVQLAIEDIMNIVAPGTEGGDPSQDSIPVSGEIAQVNYEAKAVPTATGNAALDEFLDKIHFDFSSLKDYTGTAAEKHVLHIKDTQFAAVINEALKYFGTDKAAAQLPQIAPYQKYFNHVHMGQIKIDSGISGDANKTQLQIILKIDSKDLAETALGDQLPGILKTLIKMVVPKTLFIGLDVYPPTLDENGNVVANTNAEAKVVINSLKDELAVKLMNAVGKLTGQTGEQSIMAVINNKICDIVAKINTKIPLYFEDSNCDIEPIAGLMKVLNVDITEAQFLGMIRDIKLPTPEEIIIKAGVTAKDLLPDDTRSAAVEGFIDSFTQKIAFVNKDASGNPIITPENVFEKIGAITTDQTLLSQIQFDSLEYKADGEYKAEDFKIKADYLAIAGLINSSLQGPAKDPNTLAAEETPAKKNIPVKILTFNYDKQSDMIQVVAALEITKFVEESLAGNENADIMIKFAKELLPENIFFKMGLAQDASSGKEPVIQINHLSADATKGLLDVIGAIAVGLNLGGQDFDVTKISLEMEKAVRENLDKVNGALGSEIRFDENNCVIPSIFEIVSNLAMFKDETTNKSVITDEQLHNIFRDTYNYKDPESYQTKNLSVSLDAANTSKEIEDKFFLDNIPSDATLFDELTTLKSSFADKLNVDRMVKTEGPKKTIEELKPAIPQQELGFLINGTGKLNNLVEQLKDTKVIRTEIENNKLIIEIEGTLNLEGDNAKYASILPEKLYVSVSVDTVKLMQYAKTPRPQGEVATSYTTIQFTNMSRDTMQAFANVISKISKKEFKLSDFELKIQENLENTMGTVMHGSSQGASDSLINIKFINETKDAAGKVTTPGALKIDSSIYDIAVGEIFKDELDEANKVTSAQLKQALEQAHEEPVVVNNMAKDTSRLEIDEVLGKYYVDITGEQGIFIDKIKTIKTGYFEKIRGDLMAKDTNKIEDLDLEIRGGELGKVLESKVIINVNGISDLKMEVVKILDADRLTITFKGNVDKSSLGGGEPKAAEGSSANSVFDKMLPTSIVISVTINQKLLNEYDETNPEAVLDPNATLAQINGITDPTSFAKVFTAITKKPLNVQEANEKAAKEIKKVLKELSNDVGLRFEGPTTSGFGDGVVKIDNIFVLALTQLYPDKIAGAEGYGPNNILPSELRSALQNLYGKNVPSGVGASVGEERIKEQTEIKVESSPISQINLNVNSVLTDANILNLIENNANINLANIFGVKAEEAGFKQVAFLSSTCTDPNMQKAYGNMFTNAGKLEYKDAIIVTLSVNIKSMLKKPNANLLPGMVDITMVIDLRNNNSAENLKININTMNERELLVIEDLFASKQGEGGGINKEKLNSLTTNLMQTEVINVTYQTYQITKTLEDILKALATSGSVHSNEKHAKLPTGNYYGYLEVNVPVSYKTGL